MAALEILTGEVVAAGAAFANLALGDFDAAGNINVRNFTQGTRAFLLNYWGMPQGGVPIIRGVSPRMHDNVVGIRHRPIAAQVYELMAYGYPAEVYAQDRINWMAQGSAAALDQEPYCFLMFYQSLPGSDGFFIDREQLNKLGKSITTVEIPLVAGVAGGWSGAATGNSGTQALKPNVRYALLGGHTSIMQAGIGIRCSDFGNLRLGFPGNAADKQENTYFFVQLSERYGFPLIPVFNSASLPTMLVDTANNENAASPFVTLNVCELGS